MARHDWRSIPPDEAVRHPLHGVGGWLLVYLALTGLSVLVMLPSALQGAPGALVAVLTGAAVLLLSMRRSRPFVVVNMVLLWGSAILSLLAAVALVLGPEALGELIAAQREQLGAAGVPVPEPGSDAFTAFVDQMRWSLVAVYALVAGAALAFALYFERSRRIAVTYLHRVKANDLA